MSIIADFNLLIGNSMVPIDTDLTVAELTYIAGSIRIFDNISIDLTSTDCQRLVKIPLMTWIAIADFISRTNISAAQSI